MAIIIKKRVFLEFLGEEYKDAYLIFKSIPVIDFEKIQADLKQFEKKPEGSIEFTLNLLKKYFIEGQFPGDDSKLQPVTADDLDGLDPLATIKCFKIFTGQEIDPKVETPLTSSSPTAEAPPSNT